MAENPEDYKKLLSEFIQKHMVILGPNIALDKAKAVAGLTVGEDGRVTQLSGDPQMVLKAVLNEYTALSGEVAKQIFNALLQKYPGVKQP